MGRIDRPSLAVSAAKAYRDVLKFEARIEGGFRTLRVIRSDVLNACSSGAAAQEELVVRHLFGLRNAVCGMYLPVLGEISDYLLQNAPSALGEIATLIQRDFDVTDLLARIATTRSPQGPCFEAWRRAASSRGESREEYLNSVHLAIQQDAAELRKKTVRGDDDPPEDVAAVESHPFEPAVLLSRFAARFGLQMSRAKGHLYATKELVGDMRLIVGLRGLAEYKIDTGWIPYIVVSSSSLPAREASLSQDYRQIFYFEPSKHLWGIEGWLAHEACSPAVQAMLIASLLEASIPHFLQ